MLDDAVVFHHFWENGCDVIKTAEHFSLPPEETTHILVRGLLGLALWLASDGWKDEKTKEYEA